MHRLRLILCAVLLSFCPLLAQTPNATIDGRVMDPSKAVLEGVKIEATEMDSGLKYATETNSVGLFALVNLPPGTYRLEISKTGFRSIVKPGIELHVQDVVALNIDMAVGSTLESITVQGGAPLVDTESSSVKTTVDRQFVKETPLNGRSFQTLFQLTPGVTITNTNANEQGQFSVNGQRADANYVTVDGVSANVGIASALSVGQSSSGALPALTAGGGTNGLVSVDALQEFTIQTSGYAPEFGRTPGGQISIVTRSGTNQFHGTAFDYFRNDVLDANDWFANNKGIPKAALRQNDFGGVFGGPIVPDKTFFFFSYEGLRLRQPTTGISEVPDLATRQSALPSTAAYINAFPLPTGPSEGNGLAPADYSFSNPSRIDSESLRIDHHLHHNLFAFARYNRSTSDIQSRGASGLSLNTEEHLAYKLHTATAGLVWAINPTIANDTRFNWSWSRASTFFVDDTFGGAAPISLQSVLPVGIDLNTARFELGTNGTNTEYLEGPNSRNLQQQLNILDTVSWQARTHLFKFGVDYRRLRPELDSFHYGLETLFNTAADIASGVPNLGVQVQATFDPVRFAYDNYSLFAQDNWRANRRLTLTYGLRWDYNPAPSVSGANGLPALVIVGLANYPNLAPAPPGTSLYHATIDNIAPRFGVAYDLSHGGRSTVVRAGFGEFYDMGAQASGVVGGLSPFSETNFLHPATFPITPAQAVPPNASVNPPYTSVAGFPNTLKQPYTYHWNLSMEEGIGANQAVTVGYVGAAGHGLLRTDTIGPGVIPKINNGIIFTSNSGYSKYNGLQIQFRRRSSKGLEVLGSYTFAHSLDNVSQDSPSPSITPNIASSAAQDYGSSDFDIRHTGSVAIDYQIPTLVNSKAGTALLGGWSVNSFLIARTAPPVNVIYLRDLGFGFLAYRPNLVRGVPEYISNSSSPGGLVINANAFAVPTAAIQGDLGRNALRGFPLFQQDVSISRSFHLRERAQLRARVEAFNIFNHPGFASPASDVGFFFGGKLRPLSSFGFSQAMFNTGISSASSLGAGFNPLYQVGGPRSLEAALKLEF